MDVRAGSFYDPKPFYGLAHFLGVFFYSHIGYSWSAHSVEHMLFMGTEKYPREDEFSRYLSEHSGRSNAYTSKFNTNYQFKVIHHWPVCC